MRFAVIIIIGIFSFASWASAATYINCQPKSGNGQNSYKDLVLAINNSGSLGIRATYPIYYNDYQHILLTDFQGFVAIPEIGNSVIASAPKSANPNDLFMMNDQNIGAVDFQVIIKRTKAASYEVTVPARVIKTVGGPNDSLQMVASLSDITFTYECGPHQ